MTHPRHHESSNQPPRNQALTPDLRQFLASLLARRGNQAPAPRPGHDDVTRQVTSDDDLSKRFLTQAAAAGCHTHDRRGEEWPQHIANLLSDANVREAVIDPTLPTPLATHLAAALQQAAIDVPQAVDDETLFRADAAITTVAAAIAETGSILWHSGPDHRRILTLAPLTHVAIVETGQIVPDLCDIFDTLDPATIPANVNLITGPSKTADIEGQLVTGAHGPADLHLILTDPAHP